VIAATVTVVSMQSIFPIFPISIRDIMISYCGHVARTNGLQTAMMMDSGEVKRGSGRECSRTDG